MSKLLSVIMPVYNESATILQILDRIVCVPFPPGWNLQLIIVDDASTDSTPLLVEQYSHDHPHLSLLLLRHTFNQGKGWAIRHALPHLQGQYTVIQDGDTEYHPEDLATMLSEMHRANLSVLYGSRYLGGGRLSGSLYPSYYYGVRMLTTLTNILYRQHITDEATCYKMFSTPLLQSLPLHCTRFDFCPEVTALVSRRGHHIHEIPIRYTPRSKEQGKKIRPLDGLIALWTLIKLRF